VETEADHFRAYAGHAAIMLNNVAVDRARIEVLVECPGPVVLDRPEEGTVERRTMACQGHIFLDQTLALWMDWDKPRLATFACEVLRYALDCIACFDAGLRFLCLGAGSHRLPLYAVRKPAH
jgi:hypothetical protein